MFPKIELLIGGPSCQPYSRAGKHLGLEDDRAWQLLAMLAAAVALGVRFLLIENVAALIFDDAQHGAFTDLKARCASEDYHLALSWIGGHPAVGGSSSKQHAFMLFEKNGRALPPFWHKPRMPQALARHMDLDKHPQHPLLVGLHLANKRLLLQPPEDFDVSRRNQLGVVNVPGGGSPLVMGSLVRLRGRCEKWRVMNAESENLLL